MVVHLNWLAKIELKEPGPLGRQILLLITVVRVCCCTRVLLYVKMLKETEERL